MTSTAGQTYAPDRVVMFAPRGIPPVVAGDDLAGLIWTAIKREGDSLEDDDIVVVAQKVVSKSEDRTVCLADVEPSERAIQLAAETGKDPLIAQLILDESTRVVRQQNGVVIVEHRLGFVMANAGVDQSNAAPGHAILLPLDPDASAARLAQSLSELSGRQIAVIINDSIGRAWRNGTVGHALGVAGIRPLLDLRGTSDIDGRELRVTEVALADEIAAGASALMGQSGEAKPVVLVRGFSNLSDGAASGRALLRDPTLDLFR